MDSNNINGRPDNWKELAPYNNTNGGAGYPNFEAGASAMLAAVVKWLNEKCDSHPDIASERLGEPAYYDHRYLCPQCMNELRGEK